jgi:acylphosphatase
MFVRERALDLGLSGSVRNMPDRSVRVEAEGSKEVLEALIADLHQGPPAARVERVAVDWVPPRGTAHFRVEAG